MAGLLFVFILMVVAFAAKLTDQRVRELRDRDRTLRDRTELLVSLQDSLGARGLQVEVDEKQGVLRLGAEILFPSGKAEPDSRGHENLSKLATALAAVVPRYTRSHGDTTVKHIDALFIEGHTDDVPVAIGGRFESNGDLSAAGVISVFNALTAAEVTLDRLRNELGQPILGVSGYADRRPISATLDSVVVDTMRAKNRRIDLRFIMESPFEPQHGRPDRKPAQSTDGFVVEGLTKALTDCVWQPPTATRFEPVELKNVTAQITKRWAALSPNPPHLEDFGELFAVIRDHWSKNRSLDGLPSRTARWVPWVLFYPSGEVSSWLGSDAEFVDRYRAWIKTSGGLGPRLVVATIRALLQEYPNQTSTFPTWLSVTRGLLRDIANARLEPWIKRQTDFGILNLDGPRRVSRAFLYLPSVELDQLIEDLGLSGLVDPDSSRPR